MPTVDILPVATGGGANIDSQGNFAGAGYQTQGVTAGTALSRQANKIWRQASMFAAALANFISATLSVDVLDDGNLTTLLANLTRAIRHGSSTLVVVAFSATPAFDCSLGNKFQITLTGNVTSSTLTNVAAVPGETLTFIIKQDGTGGRTFVPPGTLPLSGIDTTAFAVNIQKFEVDSVGNVFQATPMNSQ